MYFEVTVWEFKLPPPLLELGPLGGGVGLDFISHGGFPPFPCKTHELLKFVVIFQWEAKKPQQIKKKTSGN